MIASSKLPRRRLLTGLTAAAAGCRSAPPPEAAPAPRRGSPPVSPSPPGGASPAAATGRWQDLPGGADQARVTLTASAAGLYVGLTVHGRPPVVHRAPWVDPLLLGPAWVVPAPRTTAGGHREDWATFHDSVGGVLVAVDPLDPDHVAVNLIEYQGGSWGLVVGRWGQGFVDVPSPTDADIRFGQPLFLRGDELWSHDTSFMFHRALGGSEWNEVAVPDAQAVEELGWHGHLDEAGEVLVLEAWTSLQVFARRSGGFAWSHGVSLPASADLVEGCRAGVAVAMGADVRLYDPTVTQIVAAWSLPDPRGSHLRFHGDRVLARLDGELVVADATTGTIAQRWRLPDEVFDARGHCRLEATALWQDHVVVAGRGRMGHYRIA